MTLIRLLGIRVGNRLMTRHLGAALTVLTAALLNCLMTVDGYAAPSGNAEPLPSVLPPDAVLLTMPTHDQIAASNSQQFQCPETKRVVELQFSPRTEPAQVTVTSSYRKDTPEPPMGVYEAYDTCQYVLEIVSKSGKRIYREAFDWGPEWAFKEGNRSWIGGFGRTTTLALVTLGQIDKKFLFINAKSYRPLSNGWATLRIVDFSNLRRKYLVDMGERGAFAVKVDGPVVSVGGYYVGNGPMSGAKPTVALLRFRPLNEDFWPEGAGDGSALLAEKSDPGHSVESEQVEFADDWLGQLANPNFCRKQKTVDVAKGAVSRLHGAQIQYLPKDDSLHFITAIDMDGQALDGVIVVSQEYSPYVDLILSIQGCSGGVRRMKKEDFMRTLRYIHYPLGAADQDRVALPTLPAN